MALMGGPDLFWFWVVCCDASFLRDFGRPRSRLDRVGKARRAGAIAGQGIMDFSSNRTPSREPAISAAAHLRTS